MSQGRPYGVVCQSVNGEKAHIFPGTLAGLTDALQWAKMLSTAGASWAVRKDGKVLHRYQGGLEVRDEHGREGLG